LAKPAFPGPVPVQADDKLNGLFNAGGLGGEAVSSPAGVRIQVRGRVRRAGAGWPSARAKRPRSGGLGPCPGYSVGGPFLLWPVRPGTTTMPCYSCQDSNN